MKKDNNKITIKNELTDFLLYTSPNGEIKVEAFLLKNFLQIQLKLFHKLKQFLSKKVITKELLLKPPTRKACQSNNTIPAKEINFVNFIFYLVFNQFQNKFLLIF